MCSATASERAGGDSGAGTGAERGHTAAPAAPRAQGRWREGHASARARGKPTPYTLIF